LTSIIKSRGEAACALGAMTRPRRDLMGTWIGAITGTLFAAQLIVEPSVGSETVDLRKCPLDTLTYALTWGGGYFQVERVATDYMFMCESAGFLARAMPGEVCRRFGSLILSGQLDDGWEPRKRLLAIWSVMDALPCCEWIIREPTPEDETLEWLPPGEVPTLGDENVPLIDAKDETPMVAVACELR